MWTKRFLSALFRCFVPERLWHAYNNVAKIKKELKGKRRKKKIWRIIETETRIDVYSSVYSLVLHFQSANMRLSVWLTYLRSFNIDWTPPDERQFISFFFASFIRRNEFVVCYLSFIVDINVCACVWCRFRQIEKNGIKTCETITSDSYWIHFYLFILIPWRDFR